MSKPFWNDFRERVVRGTQFEFALGSPANPITVQIGDADPANVDLTAQLLQVYVLASPKDLLSAYLKKYDSNGHGITPLSPAITSGQAVFVIPTTDTVGLPSGSVYVVVTICSDMAGTLPETWLTGVLEMR